MRISDWSSDVCSSDLISKSGRTARALGPGNKCRDDSLEDDRQLATRCFPELSLSGWSGPEARPGDEVMVGDAIDDLADISAALRDRKSVVKGKSVSVRVDLGVRRIIKKTKKHISQ